MKGGGRIALGVGIGYFLGRTRKMRFALSLAGAAMARRSGGTPGDLLERGTSLLKSSPELAKITDTVRGELLGAARTAAVTAASNRIDALNDRLQQGSTLLASGDRRGSRETDADEDDYDEESSEYDEEPAEDDEQASEDEGPEDEYEEDEEDSDQPEDEDEDTERPAARTRTRRSAAGARRGAGSRAADRSSDSGDRKPTGTRARRSRADAGEAPVRRTRR
ncbi:hypothetical protein [Nocardia gamkensis]|uniref:DNA primase n=1 Tax=Nocardia gamkensis TaxID=352869 RepID=A0A7X6R3T6_9NOCA|nr:hypothetical protein [Nocardia gamkensis]NKY27596.1 hypothetical protein [Nocardia gamkensis]NQE71705.1 putative 73 protein [Nocardia gamkensis]